MAGEEGSSRANNEDNNKNNENSVSEDILNVIQSGQIKSSTSNKLSLLMDSSSDEEEKEEKIVKKKTSASSKKRAEYFDSEGDNGGFLSDGYDADFYGDAEDRARLFAMTEVEREAILYERAQARQARQERRALEQRIREREEGVTGRRAPPKSADLKRKKLDELKAKRQKRRQEFEESEEEGEFEDEEEEDYESEEKSESERVRTAAAKKKKSRKHRGKKDSDEDYYTEEEEEDVQVKRKREVVNVIEEEKGEELDLDLANKLRLTRDIIAQWVYRDGFEDIVQKSLLRINLGPGKTGQPTYRVVELKKIVQHHRTYLIKPGTPTNLAALVKFAKSERIFSFEFISNSPFTQSEFSYWKMECERAGVKLPYNSVTARRKIDKFKAFHSEPLTDAVIQGMLERRKDLTNAQNAPRNLLSEQTILQQQLKEALERNNNNEEEIARIESELAAIASKKQMSESKDRLAVMEDLNRRNRQANLETGRQAEISRMQAELPSENNSKGEASKKAPTLDPFQRRKCKPTVIHMNEAEEEPIEVKELVKEDKEVNDVKEVNEVNDVKKVNKNLFDVHNFDLDLDI